MQPPIRICLALWCAACALIPARAELAVEDDTGRTVRLAAPARRIVAVAPHVAELLYAAGAGPYTVGAVQYADWPPEVRQLPGVGSYTGFDLEALLALRPDLVVGWDSGNPPAQLARIEALGIPVFRTEARQLDDIARDLERLGRLAGTATEAGRAAAAFRERLARLRAAYAGRPPVRVFYQVWGRPLITLNGEHLVSRVLEDCGGVNVFAALPALAPQIDEEAVLHADPEVIIGGGMDGERPEWLEDWRRRWPQLAAVRAGFLYAVPPDWLHRQGPRVLDGMQRVCELLDAARAGRRP